LQHSTHRILFDCLLVIFIYILMIRHSVLSTKSSMDTPTLFVSMDWHNYKVYNYNHMSIKWSVNVPGTFEPNRLIFRMYTYLSYLNQVMNNRKVLIIIPKIAEQTRSRLNRSWVFFYSHIFQLDLECWILHGCCLTFHLTVFLPFYGNSMALIISKCGTSWRNDMLNFSDLKYFFPF